MNCLFLELSHSGRETRVRSCMPKNLATRKMLEEFADIVINTWRGISSWIELVSMPFVVQVEESTCDDDDATSSTNNDIDDRV